MPSETSTGLSYFRAGWPRNCQDVTVSFVCRKRRRKQQNIQSNKRRRHMIATQRLMRESFVTSRSACFIRDRLGSEMKNVYQSPKLHLGRKEGQHGVSANDAPITPHQWPRVGRAYSVEDWCLTRTGKLYHAIDVLGTKRKEQMDRFICHLVDGEERSGARNVHSP
ncbi:hypothetical protein BaRGS_00022565 [Batillaria attramentaria]|uniref:Uncharacterized protein n=1 Tax=Batillaria attramentaria TaxID=370345 RepID=A0ABD0KGU0_9CAEN